MGTATEHYKIGGYLDRRSFWLSNTPSAAQLEMPYVCTEAGALYGERNFVTERDSKDSYLLFYTFGGTGFVRQGRRTTTVGHGQMLLLDCRTPQPYGTDPKSDHWYHLWAHVQGAGAEATARRLGVPALTAISVPRSRVQPHWDTILERLEHDSVMDNELVGLAVHGLLSSMLIARSRDEVPSDSPVVLAQNYAHREHVDELAFAALGEVEQLMPDARRSQKPIELERILANEVLFARHQEERRKGRSHKQARVQQIRLVWLARILLAADHIVTGQTMRAYLTSERIKTAQHLLTADERSIAQIAARLRFCDQSYFTQVFRRQTGLTPRQYRNANRR